MHASDPIHLGVLVNEGLGRKKREQQRKPKLFNKIATEELTSRNTLWSKAESWKKET